MSRSRASGLGMVPILSQIVMSRAIQLRGGVYGY